jgi:hypothetical protein
MKILDWLKRRILFKRYKRITLDLPYEITIYIKKEAKRLKITVDRFVEIALEKYTTNNKNEKTKSGMLFYRA